MELLEGKMKETPGSPSISTKLEQIAKLAKEAPTMAFTTLAHHIDIEWMREAYRRTRKDGAAGVDGQTAEEYATHLEDNLRSLLERAKSGTYRAPPVRRAHIPKGDGSQMRPIGIPTFEDKILQRAVVMVLEAVYEQDFLHSSYGFRPGRSAHQALEALRNQTMDMGGGYGRRSISKFFRHSRSCPPAGDPSPEEYAMAYCCDSSTSGCTRVYRRAGACPDAGTPQGVISPLLANVYA
ncbi:MAG: reverse transcriptase domain-containing protein [Byssovorax sp.]